MASRYNAMGVPWSGDCGLQTGTRLVETGRAKKGWRRLETTGASSVLESPAMESLGPWSGRSGDDQR
jgi:hypothetical protein